MKKEHELKWLGAIKTGDLDYISTMLLSEDEAWSTLSLKDECDNQALVIHYAAMYGQLKIVQWFIGLKPKLLDSSNSKYYRTPIYFAVEQGHTDIVEYFISRGADLTYLREPGHKWRWLLLNKIFGVRDHLIHLAAKKGHLEIVKLILNKDKKALHLSDANGYTALHFAASKGHVSLVNYLVMASLDLNIRTCVQARTIDGHTALELAVERKLKDVIVSLIRHGADANLREGHLVHLACIWGWLDLLQLLLQKNPDLINQLTADGMTLLHCAVQAQMLDIVRFLILKKADLDAKVLGRNHEHYGKTALELALIKDDFEIANVLILKIASNPDHNNKHGYSLLELMLENPKCVSIVRRPSLFAQIDIQTGHSQVFIPVREVATGGFNRVRLFNNQEEQVLYVKTLHNEIKVTP